MRYRPEIDGLRAIAVFAVIVFHLDIQLFGSHLLASGYLGVDVFFVISGFLISNIIIREQNERGFSYKKFYLRRIRRILPLLSVVLVSTFIFSLFYLDQNQLVDHSYAQLSSIGMFSNFYFLRTLNYFSETTDLNPLIHTWSLSIEEQFYIIFPFILLFLLRKRILSTFLILFIISSIISVVLFSPDYPNIFFYSPWFRAWEFLAGTLVASLPKPVSCNSVILRSIKNPTLYLCLLVAFFQPLPFLSLDPGLLTIPAVTFTSLYLYFGDSPSLSKSILSMRPVAFLGWISYSLYLWHQPVLVFTRIEGLGNLSFLSSTVALMITVLLSVLSWRFLEKPFRDPKIMGVKWVITFVVMCFTVTLGIAGIVLFKGGAYFDPKSSKTLRDSFAHGKTVAGSYECVDHDRLKNKTKLWCEFGNLRSESVDFIVMGDSHAFALQPVFEKIATELELKGLMFAKSGCLPLLGFKPDRGRDGDRCVEFTDLTLTKLKEYRPPIVFMVARWNYYYKGRYDGRDLQNFSIDGNEVLDSDFNRLIALQKVIKRSLKESYLENSIVKIIHQIPEQKNIPREVYKQFRIKNDLNFVLEKSVSRNAFETFNQDIKKMIDSIADDSKNVDSLNLIDVYCLAEKCPLGTSERTFYFDRDHVSISGSMLAYPYLSSVFRELSEFRENQ